MIKVEVIGTKLEKELIMKLLSPVDDNFIFKNYFYFIDITKEKENQKRLKTDPTTYHIYMEMTLMTQDKDGICEDAKNEEEILEQVLHPKVEEKTEEVEEESYRMVGDEYIVGEEE